jgi:hypothetical protein
MTLHERMAVSLLSGMYVCFFRGTTLALASSFDMQAHSLSDRHTDKLRFMFETKASCLDRDLFFHLHWATMQNTRVRECVCVRLSSAAFYRPVNQTCTVRGVVMARQRELLYVSVHKPISACVRLQCSLWSRSHISTV